MARRVQGRLKSLDTSDSGMAVEPHVALARFQAQRGADEEHTPILARLFARRWRPAWAAAALGASFLVSLAFPLGRGLAQPILPTLRVRTVQPVRFETTSCDEKRPPQRIVSHLTSA